MNSADLVWPEHVFFGPTTQTGEAEILNLDESLAKYAELGDKPKEITPFPDPPTCQIQGPVAVLRGKKVNCLVGGAWRGVEDLEILVRRNGQWRIVAAVGDGLTDAEKE